MDFEGVYLIEMLELLAVVGQRKICDRVIFAELDGGAAGETQCDEPGPQAI